MTSTTYSNGSTNASAASAPERVSRQLETIGELALRYSVVLVLLWIGAMKFTATEAGAIEPLVASSPLMAWSYSVFSVQAVSNLIGVLEIATAVALSLGTISRRAGILGAVGGIVIFTTTLTFLITAPGWDAGLGGFPALSVVPGQFLLKDTVLLAASVSLLAKAVRR